MSLPAEKKVSAIPVISNNLDGTAGAVGLNGAILAKFGGLTFDHEIEVGSNGIAKHVSPTGIATAVIFTCRLLPEHELIARFAPENEPPIALAEAAIPTATIEDVMVAAPIPPAPTVNTTKVQNKTASNVASMSRLLANHPIGQNKSAKADSKNVVAGNAAAAANASPTVITEATPPLENGTRCLGSSNITVLGGVKAFSVTGKSSITFK
jgi:hypothetical protein